jgi:hypothetical protein
LINLTFLSGQVGSTADCPDTKTKPPAQTAWE